jgi:hypothetical protein
MKNCVGIQHKKLVPEEINCQNRRKELELALLIEEAKLMATPLTDDMDPTQWTWLEKKKMMTLDREV